MCTSVSVCESKSDFSSVQRKISNEKSQKVSVKSWCFCVFCAIFITSIHSIISKQKSNTQLFITLIHSSSKKDFLLDRLYHTRVGKAIPQRDYLMALIQWTMLRRTTFYMVKSSHHRHQHHHRHRRYIAPEYKIKKQTKNRLECVCRVSNRNVSQSQCTKSNAKK